MAICEPDGVKQTISLEFFSGIELAGITKPNPAGNSKVCFPLTSMFPEAF